MKLLVALLATALATTTATAAVKVSADSMTVDGLEVRQLQCELESGGFLATMQVVGALAKRKKALDRCAPAGAAFDVQWTWKGKGPVPVEVRRSSSPKKEACVARALKKTSSGPKGTCTAIILTGKKAAAAEAARKLLAKPATP